MHDIETFSAPFYLFRASEDCWKCGSSCRVVGLASGDDEPFVLSDIRSMPEEFLFAIIAAQPNYELRHSRMAETDYYMNTCSCGAHFGDFYLFCEPGGAFFPTEKDEAAGVEVIELPIHGEHSIDCSPGMGTGGLILKHGKRLHWGDLG
jgi:hypothetical protein